MKTIAIATGASLAFTISLAFGVHPAIAVTGALVSLCVLGAKLADILEPRLI